MSRKDIECFNCGKKGHIAMHCPSKALFCGAGLRRAVTELKVEKSQILLLDTGCSRTMARQSLAPEEKSRRTGCHYPMCSWRCSTVPSGCDVELEVEGAKVQVQAAISEKLPVSVLLGTDVPVLGKLLEANPSTVMSNGVKEVLVMTQAAFTGRAV